MRVNAWVGEAFCSPHGACSPPLVSPSLGAQSRSRSCLYYSADAACRDPGESSRCHPPTVYSRYSTVWLKDCYPPSLLARRAHRSPWMLKRAGLDIAHDNAGHIAGRSLQRSLISLAVFRHFSQASEYALSVQRTRDECDAGAAGGGLRHARSIRCSPMPDS